MIPRLSVVMTVFDGLHLVEAIESVLAQTCGDFEFIMVDDGSTDGSAEVIRKYAHLDRRIRPFFPGHQGRAGANNAGVAHATAPVIARMDHDDIALPERFARQLAWMHRHDLDVCGTHAEDFGLTTGVITCPESDSGVKTELCFRSAILDPTAMIRSSILRAEPYRDVVCEDYEMWTRLAPDYRMGNCPKVLLRHRSHAAQCHRVEAEGYRRDFARLRFLYTNSLFPAMAISDYILLARMSDRQPLESRPDAIRAGQWLVELSAPHDWWLRTRMARRWRETCDRTELAGVEIADIRVQVAHELADLVADAASMEQAGD